MLAASPVVPDFILAIAVFPYDEISVAVISKPVYEFIVSALSLTVKTWKIFFKLCCGKRSILPFRHMNPWFISMVLVLLKYTSLLCGLSRNPDVS